MSVTQPFLQEHWEELILCNKEGLNKGQLLFLDGDIYKHFCLNEISFTEVVNKTIAHICTWCAFYEKKPGHKTGWGDNTDKWDASFSARLPRSQNKKEKFVDLTAFWMEGYFSHRSNVAGLSICLLDIKKDFLFNMHRN